MANEKIVLLSDDGVNMQVTTFPEKKKEMKAFMWNEINRIRVKDDETGFLFFKKSTEKLEILTANPETPSYFNPIVVFKHQDEHFDEYVNELREYAEKKHLNFSDERKKEE